MKISQIPSELGCVVLAVFLVMFVSSRGKQDEKLNQGFVVLIVSPIDNTTPKSENPGIRSRNGPIQWLVAGDTDVTGEQIYVATEFDAAAPIFLELPEWTESARIQSHSSSREFGPGKNSVMIDGL